MIEDKDTDLKLQVVLPCLKAQKPKKVDDHSVFLYILD
jgi:hypothetical protein